MQIITSLNINNFRSIVKLENISIEDLTCIGGRNNTGKSNILRAISAFFTDEIEPGTQIDIARDCSTRPKEQKRIVIELTFNVDKSIKFPAPLQATAAKLTRNPSIRKEYTVNKSTGGFKVQFFLNGVIADVETSDEIIKFLNLFNFRYITSDRTPQRVLEENLEELRSELKYQLNKRRGTEKIAQKIDSTVTEFEDSDEQNKEDVAIKTITGLSDIVFAPITKEILKSESNITNVQISTPNEIVDLISMAKYRFTTKFGQNLSERHQGHGIQNSLLFYVLYLVDKNFHRKFGWKIATIWLVEEPETFLHFELKRRLAKYFSDKTSDMNERFQIIFTTHNELFPQYANGHLQIELKAVQNFNSTTVKKRERHEFLQWMSSESISTIMPLSALYPDNTIVVVEGHKDELTLRGILKPEENKNVQIFSIDRFNGESHGGDSKLDKLIDENLSIINARDSGSPMLFVYDWDYDRKGDVSARNRKFVNGSKMVVMDESKSNPRLGRAWKGIERYMDDDVVEGCSAFQDGLITINRGKRYVFDPSDYKTIKNSIYEFVKANNISYKYLYAYRNALGLP